MCETSFNSLYVKEKAKFYEDLCVHYEIDVDQKLKCHNLETENTLSFNGAVKCYGNLTAENTSDLSSTNVNGQIVTENMSVTGNVTDNANISVTETTIVINPLNYTLLSNNIIVISDLGVFPIRLPEGTDGITIYCIVSGYVGSGWLSSINPDQISGNWYCNSGVAHSDLFTSVSWILSIGDILKFTYISGIWYMETYAIDTPTFSS